MTHVRLHSFGTREFVNTFSVSFNFINESIDVTTAEAIREETTGMRAYCILQDYSYTGRTVAYR